MLTIAAQMDLLKENPYCNAKNNMVSLCLCFTWLFYHKVYKDDNCAYDTLR